MTNRIGSENASTELRKHGKIEWIKGIRPGNETSERSGCGKIVMTNRKGTEKVPSELRWHCQI